LIWSYSISVEDENKGVNRFIAAHQKLKEASDDPDREIPICTCLNCKHLGICPHAWNPYNADGNCLNDRYEYL
jgi:hypothetical protein